VKLVYIEVEVNSTVFSFHYRSSTFIVLDGVLQVRLRVDGYLCLSGQSYES